MTTASDIRLFDLDEVAERLSLSPITVKNPRWREHRGLRCTRIGSRVLVAEDDLREFVERYREKAGVGVCPHCGSSK